MKREARTILTILFMTFVTSITYSQTDSIRVEYSQEKITKANKTDEAICDILTRREKREKDLWKLNLAGTFLGGFDIAFEKRIAAKWSCNIQSVTNFPAAIYRGEIKEYFRIWDNWDGAFEFSQNLNFQLRYYYNLNRRARLGKKCGFSGNYFGLSLNNQYLFEQFLSGQSYVSNGIVIQPPVSHFNQVRNSLNLTYGLQRKIGKVGYIDASIGLGLGVERFLGTGNRAWYVIALPAIQPKLGIGIAF